VRLGAILQSFGFNGVASLFVHLKFKKWSTSGIDIVTCHIDDLINGIEMDREVLGHGLGIFREVTPNFFEGIFGLELVDHAYQFLLEGELLSDFMFSCLF